VHPVFTPNPDPVEAALEARELGRYLLAKSYFDCKEFERCAAVFLPDSILASSLTANVSQGGPAKGNDKGKGKGKAVASSFALEPTLPEISQKSLFLALYAKVMAGEKHKDEEVEMIMGPQDLGSVVNKQLVLVSRFLTRWFAERRADDGAYPASQGFLEYLYGMVLAKEKNDDLALEYLMQSVHLFPWNWGAWLEITNLVSRVEQVSSPSLSSSRRCLLTFRHSSTKLHHSCHKTSCHLSSMPTPQSTSTSRGPILRRR
jgi:anaphase-promoting complex subunit 8